MESWLKSLVVLVAMVPCIVIVDWVGLRLLGVRRSWTAKLSAGLFGGVLGVVLAYLLADYDVLNQGFVRNALIFAFLLTMLFAVGIDLIAKPGTLAVGDQAGLFTLPRPISDARKAIADARRTREILEILRANGFGPVIGVRSRRNRREVIEAAPLEVRLQRTLEQCGGMFVKLGQVASTRGDILPPNVIDVLAQLQSDVAPETPDAVREVIEADLGRRVEDVFEDFTWEPIAAASIGQVHAATLPGGQPVIVKVQRPRVDEIVRRDSEVLLRVARMIEASTPFGQQYAVYPLAQEFVRSLAEELDFTVEAANTATIRENMAGEVGIAVPAIYDDHCTRRVMVQERFVGVQANAMDPATPYPVSTEEMADRLLHALLTQMLTDGFFHADLHPGNLLVMDDGTLGMIDFGATGRLDPLMQSSLRTMLIAVALRDAALLRQSLGEITDIDPEVDPEALERALARFMAAHLAEGQSVSATAVRELLEMLTHFGIAIPSELTTFSRALVVLEGTLATICPGYRLSEHAQAFGEEWATPAATDDVGDLQDLATKELLAQLPTLRQLPRRTDRVLEQLEHGTLSMRLSLFAGEHDMRFVTKMVNRMTLAFLGSVLGVVAVLLFSTQESARLPDGTPLLHAVGYVALTAAFVLMLRVVAAVVRDGLN